jgi:poly-gamma-glutamate synthesis protein (capsule biosynthesis protein)
MPDIYRPILKLVVFGLAIWLITQTLFTLQYATQTHIDPRIENGIEVINPHIYKRHRLGWLGRRFVWVVQSLIDPPKQIYALDPPPKDYTPATYYQNFFSLVGPFTTDTPPLYPTEAEFLKPLGDVPVYTDNILLYGKYHPHNPTIELVGGQKTLLKKIKEEKGFGFIPMDEVTTQMRVLSPPVPVTLWIGWKENNNPFLEAFAVNYQMMGSIDVMLAHAKRTQKTTYTSIVVTGGIYLDPFRGFDMQSQERFINQGDITVGLLHSPVQEMEKKGATPGFILPSTLPYFKKAGFTMFNLANDTISQKGSVAIGRTYMHLDSAGFELVGAGGNHKEAAKPRIVTLGNQTRVGFLAYSQVLPGGAPTFKQGGVNPFQWERLKKEVAQTKEQCDLLVVQIFQDPRKSLKPSKTQKQVAHLAIDLGADFVIGHHPGGVQAVERYKDKFIAYGVGDFLNSRINNKWTQGLIIKADFRADYLFNVQIEPVRVTSLGVEPEPERAKVLGEIYEASLLPRPSRN